jgi:hypothetical protein
MGANKLPVLVGDDAVGLAKETRRVLVLAGGESIIVGSEEWLTWLEAGQSFRYEGSSGNVTVRLGKGGWYAYKKIHGKLYSAFVAAKYDVTIEKLEVVTGDLIRKGEENKPAVQLTEIDELRSLVFGLRSELQIVKVELKELDSRLGELLT